jgi:hypothetical protein
MGGPPPTAQVVRRGTSKAVPIVVSAGLAVGVFCGLLFGLGVESTAATTPTTVVTKADKKNDGFNVAPAEANPSANNPIPAKTTPAASTGSGSAAPAATGSGSAAPAAATGSGSAAPAAGTGSGSAAPAAGTGSGSAAPVAGTGSGSAAPTKTEPVVATKAKVIVEITPEAAAKDAHVSIDGSDVTTMTNEIDLGKTGKKTIKVKVTSTGYKTVEQKVDLDGADATVKFELVKKPSGPAPIPSGPRPGGHKDGKSGKSGGGLIDI